MSYKISGNISEDARIIIINESDWSIESNTQESPNRTQSKPPKPSYPKPINPSKNSRCQGATTPTLPSVDTNFRTVNPMYKYNV